MIGGADPFYLHHLRDRPPDVERRRRAVVDRDRSASLGNVRRRRDRGRRDRGPTPGPGARSSARERPRHVAHRRPGRAGRDPLPRRRVARSRTRTSRPADNAAFGLALAGDAPPPGRVRRRRARLRRGARPRARSRPGGRSRSPCSRPPRSRSCGRAAGASGRPTGRRASSRPRAPSTCSALVGHRSSARAIPAGALAPMQQWARARVARARAPAARRDAEEIDRGRDRARVLRGGAGRDLAPRHRRRDVRSRWDGWSRAWSQRRRENAVNELRDRVVREVRKVVVGQDHVVEVLLAAVDRRRSRAARRRARCRQDAARQRVRPRDRRRLPPRAVHARHAAVGPHRHDDAARRASSRSGPGPVFTNLLLADEINRTPPKTQAALLEAMQERQVSVDGIARPLPDPFVVVATQNPIEYEGTYPLPEAQLDRFLAKLDVGYPSVDDEAAMLRLAHHGVAPATLADVQAVTSPAELLGLRDARRRDDGDRRDRRLRRRARAPHARAPERRARREPARRGAPARRGEGGGAARGPRLRDPRRRRRGRARGAAAPAARCGPKPSSSATAPTTRSPTAIASVPVPR